MYTSFKIENFRGFKSFEIDDLARVNLIAGKNNVGKTSVLEAIMLHAGKYNLVLSRMLSDINDLESSRSLRRSRPNLSGFRGWEELFNGLNTSKRILLVGDGTFMEGKQLRFDFADSLENEPDYALKIESIDARQIEDEFIFRNISLEDNYSTQNIKALHFTYNKESQHSIIQYPSQDGRNNIRDNFPLPRLNVVYVSSRDTISDEINANRFSELKKSRQVDFLVEALQVIEPRLMDLDLLADGIYADIDGLSELVPLSTMGDGLGRLNSIILALASARYGYLMTDEIENGLHHSAHVDVWKVIDRAAKQFNTQVFATTHSLEMIRAAHMAFSAEDPYDFRLHRLDRHPRTGDIEAVTYDQETLAGAIAMNFEVR